MSPIILNPYLGTAGGGASTPDVILGTDLIAWYKRGTGIYDAVAGGSLVTTNNQEIGRWEDQSGNGYHATRSSAIGFGNLRWNTTTTDRSFGTIFFSGDGGIDPEHLLLPDALGVALQAAGAGEMWMRFKASAYPYPQDAYTLGTAAFHSNFWNDGNIYDDFGSTTRYVFGYAVNLATGFHVYNPYSATNDWQSFLDTVSMKTSGTNTVGFPSSGLKIGNQPGGGNDAFAGWMSEIVFAKIKASGTQRSQMYTYLTT